MPAKPGLQSDLIPFPRCQPRFHERGAGQRFDHPTIADRFLPLRVAGVCPLLNQRL
jgi:hypothetical protein